jgi:DNA/RNA endonuclease YhcR with UshA esterase domain
MRVTKIRNGIFAAALFIAAVPLSAHHSFAAEYDADKPIQVTGTVTKVEWTNPHARIYVDAKDEKGNVTNWNFELGGPLQLNRLGWKRDAVKAGDQVTVQGYLAKDGAKMANARNVVFADGRKIFAGSSGDGGPPR